MLREVMRSTAGLEALCSDLVYFRQLKPGEETSLDARPMSLKWHKEIRSRYPTLKPGPEGLVYLVFVNITANSESEFGGGTSRINPHNVSAVVDHLIWVVCDAEVAGPSEIGVATPYAGQVNYDLDVLRKAQRDRPDHDWQSLRIGTIEWFMG